MKMRLMALFLVVVLALSLTSLVSAQQPGCFDLSADDCAVIQAASANSNSITSFDMAFELDIVASNLGALQMLLPDLPETVTFNVTGVGPFQFVPDSDMPFEMYLDMTVDADAGSTMQVSSEFPFAVSNGFMYGPFAQDGSIVGIPLDAEDLTSAAGGATGGVVLVDPSSMTAGSIGDLMAGSEGMGTALTDFEQYFTYTRGDDVDLAGMTASPFVFTLDLTSLLQSPEFASSLEMTDSLAGDDPSIAQGLAMIPMLLEGVVSELSTTQYVVGDMVQGLGTDVYFEMDLSSLMGAAPGSMQPVVVEVDFEVVVTNLNTLFEINAPDGATELSPEEAKALMDSLGL